jgi:hypothetical protein
MQEIPELHFYASLSLQSILMINLMYVKLNLTPPAFQIMCLSEIIALLQLLSWVTEA